MPRTSALHKCCNTTDSDIPQTAPSHECHVVTLSRTVRPQGAVDLRRDANTGNGEQGERRGGEGGVKEGWRKDGGSGKWG